MRTSVADCSKLFIYASLLVCSATSAFVINQRLKTIEAEERFRVIGQEIEKLPKWRLGYRTFSTEYFIDYFRKQGPEAGVFLIMNRGLQIISLFVRPEDHSQAIKLRGQLKSIDPQYDLPLELLAY